MFVCPICNQEVESEEHVITRCPAYIVPRDILYNACVKLCPVFNAISDSEKLCFVLSNPDICILSAKTCHTILQYRRSLLYIR